MDFGSVGRRGRVSMNQRVMGTEYESCKVDMIASK